MKNLYKILFKCSILLLVPAAANAAGTYYTGGYQSPQQSRYTQKTYNVPRANTYSGSQGLSQYTQKQYANAGYTTTNQQYRTTQQRTQQSVKSIASDTSRNGLHLDAGISKQVAMWQFEMNTAGSKLHYDNIDWLTFDVGGKYVFDAGKTKMQIDAGFLYGIQTGESTMTDDDISHGGYIADRFYDSNDPTKYIGAQYGYALSTSTSDGGSMMGFNAGLGLTDFIKIGKIKITPSIGWRYFKYELESKNTSGMVMSTFDFNNSCVTTADGQTDCAPAMVFFNAVEEADKSITISNLNYSDYVFDFNQDGLIDNLGFEIPTGLGYADALNTFYFNQTGVSHSYEVEWSGPYLALDMLYDINTDNIVNARLEFGIPGYTAIGDQPYRYDWAHPKSIEDKGGLGSAFHFGAGANWLTKITDSVSLSIGVTYDYYTVSDADATTFLNPSYGQQTLDTIFAKWQKMFPESTAEDVELYMLNGVIIEDVPQEDGTFKDIEISADQTAIDLTNAKRDGWKIKTDSEIESFYKSLGIRIGLNARF